MLTLSDFSGAVNFTNCDRTPPHLEKKNTIMEKSFSIVMALQDRNLYFLAGWLRMRRREHRVDVDEQTNGSVMKSERRSLVTGAPTSPSVTVLTH